ncbi:hypothetical protein PDESU_01063 [Pontiella desulfatans]|uniref:Uncharacterized protein n=2 Tax=Pontiella desulfatans TaxID=2750659 RepID=A0A6C2TXW5_PONDE|nr:hypothetical protein PDESU_01063 [Pontiella desulfatans]
MVNRFSRQRLSVMVPMRDGVRLSCDIRFPKGLSPSTSPFCKRQSTCSVRSPPKPMLKALRGA